MLKLIVVLLVNISVIYYNIAHMAESALYAISETDLVSGRDAYIRYLGGVAVLHNPFSGVAKSLIGDQLVEKSDTSREVITRHAEQMIWDGLTGLAKYANPEDRRSNLSTAEYCFDEVKPNILKIVDSVYSEQPERVDLIDDSFRAIRPNPLIRKVLYGYVCHSRRNKILTDRVLEGFMPSSFFGQTLNGRTLNGTYSS